jgi:hypothetical protein
MDYFLRNLRLIQSIIAGLKRSYIGKPNFQQDVELRFDSTPFTAWKRGGIAAYISRCETAQVFLADNPVMIFVIVAKIFYGHSLSSLECGNDLYQRDPPSSVSNLLVFQRILIQFVLYIFCCANDGRLTCQYYSATETVTNLTRITPICYPPY